MLAATPSTETAAKETPTIVVPVDEILAEIGRDSRRDPQQYLDESVTPFGGE
jgi:hypothetical protein